MNCITSVTDNNKKNPLWCLTINNYHYHYYLLLLFAYEGTTQNINSTWIPEDTQCNWLHSLYCMFHFHKGQEILLDFDKSDQLDILNTEIGMSHWHMNLENKVHVFQSCWMDSVSQQDTLDTLYFLMVQRIPVSMRLEQLICLCI